LAAACAIGQTGLVIRKVVIHQIGQLPIVGDLRELPAPGDVNLVCTNLRTVDGKRPTFIDHTDSWFLIPLVTVRFVEVPKGAMAGSGEDEPFEPEEELTAPEPTPVDEGPNEPDEDLLARIRNI
jgi:hypothetical protein